MSLENYTSHTHDTAILTLQGIDKLCDRAGNNTFC